MPFYTIDLCAGIGGIRKGFELTGQFENIAAAEIDPYACMTYQHLYNVDANHDVTSEEFKLAGFPCQTFSRAGLEEGFNDEDKGVIFNHIAEIIRRTRPRAVFLENVDNLVRHDKGRTFRIIINTLERTLNYKVVGVTYDENGLPQYNARDFVRNSRFFGIPQNRPRTYIMAFDRERYGTEALLGIQNYLPEENDWYLYEDLNELLEMHAEQELEYAELEPDLCGINNRNLGSFVTDVENSFRLAELLPKEAVKVSESGISNPDTVKALRQAGFRGFLIGENFMKTPDPGGALGDFIAQL